MSVKNDVSGGVED